MERVWLRNKQNELDKYINYDKMNATKKKAAAPLFDRKNISERNQISDCRSIVADVRQSPDEFHLNISKRREFCMYLSCALIRLLLNYHICKYLSRE